ncbi:MAG TPA: hypothetical protein VGS07_27345 [Thermoanaerobaculia bacterium]|jgi:hypothetical protein|nr:hypothetical protein [Thermoanaerobaculia bacterium]
MRRFSTATVLGGLLLLGASGSLAASDTPKVPRPAARRKAVASKPPSTAGKVDVKLDNLYVDSEIGQVFTVNLGRADQPVVAGETASLGNVQVYQLGGNEIEPPATAVTPQPDPEETEPAEEAEPAEPAEEMEAPPQPGNAAEAPEATEAADPDESMAPEADESAEDPATDPAAAPQDPQTGQAPAKPDPAAGKAPAAPAAKEAPKTPPPAGSTQAPPPPPPPIR